MIIYFHNYQDELDPNNGRAISRDDELSALLDHARKAPPFVAEFCGASDFHITIGVGGDFGCVQYSRVDGMPPYLVAVSHHPPMKRGCIEFLCGGTPTPIGSSNILTFEEMKEVVLHFLKTGERSDSVSWRPVGQATLKKMRNVRSILEASDVDTPLPSRSTASRFWSCALICRLDSLLRPPLFYFSRGDKRCLPLYANRYPLPSSI